MDQPESRNMYAAIEGKWYAGPNENTARIPRIENCKHCLNRYQTPQVGSSAYCGITQDNLRGYQDMINYDGGVLVDPPVQQNYIEGSKVTLNFQLTAHHRGHVEFGMCCKDPSKTSDTKMQECFNRNKLKFLRDIRYEANPDPNYPWRGYVAPSGSPVSAPAPRPPRGGRLTEGDRRRRRRRAAVPQHPGHPLRVVHARRLRRHALHDGVPAPRLVPGGRLAAAGRDAGQAGRPHVRRPLHHPVDLQ